MNQKIRSLLLRTIVYIITAILLLLLIAEYQFLVLPLAVLLAIATIIIKWELNSEEYYKLIIWCEHIAFTCVIAFIIFFIYSSYFA